MVTCGAVLFVVLTITCNLKIASTGCANLPSYLIESSNFNGGDGSVKVRCKQGKIFNITTDGKETLDCTDGDPTSWLPEEGEDACIPGAVCKLEDATK